MKWRTMEQKYMNEIRRYIVENIYYGEADQLLDDMSFAENGILDSTGMLELITFMEETYGIHIEDDELIPENLDSLRNIAKYLHQKIDASSSNNK